MKAVIALVFVLMGAAIIYLLWDRARSLEPPDYSADELAAQIDPSMSADELIAQVLNPRWIGSRRTK